MRAIIIETCVVEVTEHGLVGCVLHRGLVLRSIPHFRFRLMATRAGFTADETRFRRKRAPAPEVKETKAGGNDDDRRSDRGRPDQAPSEYSGLFQRRDLRQVSRGSLRRSICITGFATLMYQRPSLSVP